MFKKVWLLPVLSMAVLSACGGGGGGDAAPGTEIQPPAKRDPIELVVYHPFPQDWNEEDFMKTFGEPMRQKYPHITFKYIVGGKIQDLLTAGQKIDIYVDRNSSGAAYRKSASIRYNASYKEI